MQATRRRTRPGRKFANLLPDRLAGPSGPTAQG